MLSVNQIADIEAQAFIGEPSIFLNVGKVYPFTLKEIIGMGITIYNSKLSLLLLTEIEIADLVKKKTGEDISLESIEPLTYLLQSAAMNDMFSLELQNTFSTFLKEEILLLPKINSVLVGPPEERRLITKDNFSIFQDILRIQNHREVKVAPPKNETAGERKMRLLRERVEEVKRKQAQKQGKNPKFTDLLEMASVFGVDLNTCTFYAFQGLLKRYQRKEQWEQNLAMICAGADPKKVEMKYWGADPDE